MMEAGEVKAAREGSLPAQDAPLPFQDAAQTQAQLLASVAVAVLVLLALLIWKFVQSRKSSRRAVLLVGLCDSGKTLLFVRLLTGNFRNTQTSITDSSALYRVKNDKNTNVTLIDLPGHESLRLQLLDKFKAAARLYVTMAKSSKLIQQQLERELNTLRVTLSAAPSTLDSSSSGSASQLGKKGKEFDFSQLPMKVEFIECSARGSKGEEGSADIEELERWLAKIA
ncbi:hypothetical protein JD844_007181 [Phrynosoma platyrhinos]|uniref:Signal recognition particle receptor subunit beta n=1 Tax=Phrynosoma platyrhinos TaxID=52577 RepID=A0ABQ7T2K9_PHRPL|nr:hypothetical protein JD844_007181 [Phrynosoma platyrhinos]